MLCQEKIPTIAINTLSNSPSNNNTVLPNPKAAYIYSTGTSFGNHYTTDQVLQALTQKQKNNKSFDIGFASRVLAKCGFDTHSFALPLSDVFRRYTREEYLVLRKVQLVKLAERAGNQALE